MKDTKKPDQCQHEACSCPLAETGDYCSEYCETAAGGEIGEGCQCGHPDCVE